MRFVPILFYLCCSLFYYDYSNTFFSIDLWNLTPGARSLVSIGRRYFIQKGTMIQMNDVD